jgi:hypothetical protein
MCIGRDTSSGASAPGPRGALIPAPSHLFPIPMTIPCIILWALALIVLPLLILDWITLSRSERIRRLRALGWSQQRIAEQLGCSRYQVRKALA